MKDSMPVLLDVLTKLATHKPVPRGDLLKVMTEISAVLDRVAALEEATATVTSSKGKKASFKE